MIPRSSSVSRHVILTLVAITALVFAGMGTFLFLNERQHTLAEVRAVAAVSCDQLASGLALSVWNLDEAQARKNMESVMGNRTIVAIELEAKGMAPLRLERDANWNPCWAPTVYGLSGDFVEQRRIEFSNQEIGLLRLSATPSFALEFLHAQLGTIIVVFVLFELGLALALSLLIWRSVLIPLRVLERYAVGVAEDSAQGGALQARGFRGELERLRASIEKMVALLRERIGQVNREAALRRESEERMRALYDSVSDGIMIISPETGRLLDVNTRSCEMYGGTREELLASTIGQLSSGEDPYTHENYERRIQGLETDVAQLFEWRCRRRDGSLYWGELNARRTRIGTQEMVLLVLRDISGRKRQEEERRMLEAQLSQSQKLESIGILAGGIAHDFNNILSAIVGYCELAREEAALQPALADYLSEIRTAALRARDLVRQILTFSRRTRHQMEPVLMPMLVREVLKLLRATFPAEVEIVDRIVEPLPLVLADPSQLHQVLMNLCANAEHAMRGKRGTLTVSLDAVRLESADLLQNPGLHAGEYLVLGVGDTGHGMDEETLKHIFDPFFTTKRAGEGTGLGMAVVHGIIKAHNGAIMIDSRPGEGTVFHVFLPALSGEGVACQTIPDTRPQGAGQRVLFVDNEVILCRIAEKLLLKLGYEATVLSDPLQVLALPAAKLASLDLVVTDLAMPGMGGLELAAELHRRHPGLPIMVMTGFISPERMQEARDLGVVELLMKPLDTETLSRAIARHLPRR